MSDNVLLVPIRLDALYTDGSVKLAAPMADFSKLPYHWSAPTVAPAPPPASGVQEGFPPPPPPPSGVGVNGDQAFLGQTVFRGPNPSFDGANDTWTPPAGLHLHWALPDALTSQRVTPGSDGKARFPQAPNRWLLVLSTQNSGVWTETDSWVVESDYLYSHPDANPDSGGANAISFPIAPLDAFKAILEAAPPPSNHHPTAHDIATFPFFYQAPFRSMGRKAPLSAWQVDIAGHEYLTDYNPEGLTAIGYGHPLFAAIYSNCFSVFGACDAGYDPASSAGFPRRYDLIGWYDDADNDSLAFFQQLATGTDPWDALKAEYGWVDAARAGDTGNMPTRSVYYSRLEIDGALTAAFPAASATLTVGNTATEALSAHLASTLACGPVQQVIVEEQLEAMGLQPTIGAENIDLGAKFRQARHDKGFKKIDGGSLWSVRAKSTKTSASTPTTEAAGEVTLPGGLAQAMNELNLVQAAYDGSWNEIDSLRQRMFSDWVRLEYRRVTAPASVPSLPSENDILAYSLSSALSPLQQRMAATGEVAFGKDAQGKTTVTMVEQGQQVDVTVHYSLAQQLLDALNDVLRQLGAYNAGSAAQAAQLDYYVVRKGGPRFYQANDPAVLLAGEAVVASERHGADNELPCSVVVVGAAALTDSLRQEGKGKGVFGTLLAHIDMLSAAGGRGFATQRTQPWNPVSLEWSTQVWPERRNTGLGVSGEGIQYASNYLAGSWELDVDSSDVSLNVRPYGLANPEAPYDYTGRAILVSHAPARLQHSVAAYLLPLSLADLKTGGARDQVLTDELDYQYDLLLLAWAAAVFGVPQPPFLANLKDPATLTAAQIAAQQNQAAAWLATQYPFQTQLNGKWTLIDLAALVASRTAWCNSRPVMLDTGVLGEFGTLSSDEQTGDPLRTAVLAYNAVTGKSLLSQALSGFNDAMLTEDREFQLPVWDWRAVPLDGERQYVRDVSRNLGDGHSGRIGPLFDGTFLPFRSGLMQVSGLTLVDSFGQYLPLDFGGAAATLKSERMTILDNVAASVSDPSTIATSAENLRYIYLAPRVSQAARLNFRWLAADQANTAGQGDEMEMNDHPTTTPVCGWVLPNNIDGSLAIYDSLGSPLGALVQSHAGGAFSIAWESAPGINKSTPLAGLANPHLQNFAAHILAWGGQSQAGWDAFLGSINSALQDIDPKSFAQNPALSLLIGRPMAVVRASIGLEVKGLPAVDHSVPAFNYDLANQLFTRTTNGFENVAIPVRLGEASQLNDGLVAYWVEDGQGGMAAEARFPELESMDAVAGALRLSLAGPALKLTMLVDPRGVVHASCGVLPVKDISIPPDQYAQVLRTLSVTFLTSPILTSKKEIQLGLPVEGGYGWSWLDRPTGFTWNRVADIKPAVREAKYEQQRILEGWLTLTPQAEKQIS